MDGGDDTREGVRPGQVDWQKVDEDFAYKVRKSVRLDLDQEGEGRKAWLAADGNLGILAKIYVLHRALVCRDRQYGGGKLAKDIIEQLPSEARDEPLLKEDNLKFWVAPSRPSRLPVLLADSVAGAVQNLAVKEFNTGVLEQPHPNLLTAVNALLGGIQMIRHIDEELGGLGPEERPDNPTDQEINLKIADIKAKLGSSSPELSRLNLHGAPHTGKRRLIKRLLRGMSQHEGLLQFNLQNGKSLPVMARRVGYNPVDAVRQTLEFFTDAFHYPQPPTMMSVTGMLERIGALAAKHAALVILYNVPGSKGLDRRLLRLPIIRRLIEVLVNANPEHAEHTRILIMSAESLAETGGLTVGHSIEKFQPVKMPTPVFSVIEAVLSQEELRPISGLRDRYDKIPVDWLTVQCIVALIKLKTQLQQEVAEENSFFASILDASLERNPDGDAAPKLDGLLKTALRRLMLLLMVPERSIHLDILMLSLCGTDGIRKFSAMTIVPILRDLRGEPALQDIFVHVEESMQLLRQVFAPSAIFEHRMPALEEEESQERTPDPNLEFLGGFRRLMIEAIEEADCLGDADGDNAGRELTRRWRLVCLSGGAHCMDLVRRHRVWAETRRPSLDSMIRQAQVVLLLAASIDPGSVGSGGAIGSARGDAGQPRGDIDALLDLPTAVRSGRAPADGVLRFCYHTLIKRDFDRHRHSTSLHDRFDLKLTMLTALLRPGRMVSLGSSIVLTEADLLTLGQWCCQDAATNLEILTEIAICAIEVGRLDTVRFVAEKGAQLVSTECDLGNPMLLIDYQKLLRTEIAVMVLEGRRSEDQIGLEKVFSYVREQIERYRELSSSIDEFAQRRGVERDRAEVGSDWHSRILDRQYGELAHQIDSILMKLQLQALEIEFLMNEQNHIFGILNDIEAGAGITLRNGSVVQGTQLLSLAPGRSARRLIRLLCSTLDPKNGWDAKACRRLDFAKTLQMANSFRIASYPGGHANTVVDELRLLYHEGKFEKAASLLSKQGERIGEEEEMGLETRLDLYAVMGDYALRLAEQSNFFSEAKMKDFRSYAKRCIDMLLWLTEQRELPLYRIFAKFLSALHYSQESDRNRAVPIEYDRSLQELVKETEKFNYLRHRQRLDNIQKEFTARNSNLVPLLPKGAD